MCGGVSCIKKDTCDVWVSANIFCTLLASSWSSAELAAITAPPLSSGFSTRGVHILGIGSAFYLMLGKGRRRRGRGWKGGGADMGGNKKN